QKYRNVAQDFLTARSLWRRRLVLPGSFMETTTIDDIQARDARHVLQTYKRSPVTFVRGQGVRLYDTEGREYLDLLSGIGVASLGHAHPGLARAIADQAQTLIHTSNLFYHPLQGQLAER